MFAGTTEIASLMADLAPSIRQALNNDDAHRDDIRTTGLQLLAQRKSTSHAVRLAQETMAQLHG
ncbi:hypothetical protein CMUST_09980 [Corynebacterium mustelae]|uniref:Uncharacterized protein n=1 Tax=Corynebacterium mustelae TaxID=571915 RepID=A0A0G3H5C2_9CORY|nr:hypothetical protein [Corynebacterium mustelae]AKK06312.1 hypothetical protein CMUST_09980 [Corynebacterium mustelae]